MMRYFQYFICVVIVLANLVRARSPYLNEIENNDIRDVRCADMPLLGSSESEEDHEGCSDFTGPEFPPTHGEIWPTPKKTKKEDKFFEMSPNIMIELDEHVQSCSVLDKMTKHFLRQISSLYEYSNQSAEARRHEDYAGDIKLLKIEMEGDCEDLPHAEMSEIYKLKISSNILIEASSIWAVARALDSLVQLSYINRDKMLVVNKNYVEDRPKYKHRGLMLDTETHFISFDNILKMLDAMAMNKLNVLHWRIVGDYSFPFESKAFPYVSKGAVYKTLIYDEKTIKEIVDFATVRGIRIIPEFNIPGHMRSLDKGNPELVTKCFSDDPISRRLGPLDPSEATMFDFLTKLMDEVQRSFPDDHIHLGGEDIDEDCWTSNPDVMKYQKLKLIFLDMHLHFIQKLLQDILKPDTKLILDYSVLDSNTMADVALPKGTKAQVYTEYDYKKAMGCNEHSVIISWPWDLSDSSNMTFAHMYDKASDITKICNCVGGEAFLLSHMVEDTNIFDRVWPMACAAADILWHGMDSENDIHDKSKLQHIHRIMQEHTCRMARLGIPVGPVGSGYCEVYEDLGEDTHIKP